MKVRMVDVARRLGLSKATVSLAVNGKPGVSEETRTRVLACMEEMEQAQESGGTSSAAATSSSPSGVGPFSSPGQASISGPASPTAPISRSLIKVLIINHNKQVVQDPELDLWSETLAALDTTARRMGYLYSLTYMSDLPGERDACIEECNQAFVSGVFLFATEMDESDDSLLQLIRKPMVVYDCEIPDGSASCICADNDGAVHQAVRLLQEKGASHILYMSTSKEIYNFDRRRRAFDRITAPHRDTEADTSVPMAGERVALGRTIPEITRNARTWLSLNGLPDAFLFENYQVSIGMTTALRDLDASKVPVPPMVGIDLVPEYLLSGLFLPQIRIPHAQRAVLAMEQLDRQIRNPETIRVKIFAATLLIEE